MAKTGSMTDTAPARTALPLSLLLVAATLALTELTLTLADAGVIGSPRWRANAISYGGLWQGLWKDWRPNFAAQPATMLLTYSLLHAGFGHAAGNLAAFWVLGRFVFDSEGAGRLWAVYGLSVLTGALVFILASDTPRPVIGASGGIYGLAMAAVIVDWRRRIRDAIPGAHRRAAVLTAALLASNWLSWWMLDGELAWQAHLGGMLGALGLATGRRPAQRDAA